MICPNCNVNMSDKRKRCERCGTDVTIYKKVLRASNLYYNNGLAKVKVRDLSGAIIALRKSLDLNKLNTNARNLLGLVYYEMGETVAALSEWVISKHFQPDENDADEYIDKLQSNLTKLDSLNQAIKRYNTALGLAKQKSDDLAIIQLKKVVSLNANFIRAYQLLALLLIKTGDKERARKYLLRANKIDVSNTTTLKYLRELDVSSAKDIEANPEAEQGKMGSIMPISSYREDKPNIIAYVNIIVGIVIGLAVMAILVIPTIKKNQSSEDKDDFGDNGYTIAQIQDKDNTIKQLQGEKDELESQMSQLQSQIDTLNHNKVTEEETILLNAARLYIAELIKPENTRDFTAVSDLLADITEGQLETDQANQLFTLLKNETFPSAAKTHYENGHNQYSQGNYQAALSELQMALKYDPLDVNAIYFMARSYHRLNDRDNAITYYNKVITQFPDSNRVPDAKKFLKQVQAQ